MNGESNSVVGNSNIIRGANNKNLGHQNKIGGAFNNALGNKNEAIGDYNSMKGNQNTVKGSYNMVGDLDQSKLSSSFASIFDTGFLSSFKGNSNQGSSSIFSRNQKLQPKQMETIQSFNHGALTRLASVAPQKPNFSMITTRFGQQGTMIKARHDQQRQKCECCTAKILANPALRPTCPCCNEAYLKSNGKK